MNEQSTVYSTNFGADYASQLPTLGDSLCEILQFFGVNTIYGVGGDFAANLIKALENRIEVTASSNEMHGAFSACAEAEINGIGASISTFTVGSLPCTSAAALAKTERLPVIFLSGAPAESEVKEGSIHHTVVSSSTWQINFNCALNAFAALGIRAERLQGARSKEQPNMAAEHFFQLVTHAFLNKEPVFIEIPRDLVFQPTQALQLPTSLNELHKRNFVLKGAELIAQHVEEKLSACSSPLLYIGDNIKLNKTLQTSVINLIHQLNIPFVTSWLAKGIFDESDPLCLGTYNGVFSHPATRHYVEKCADYILEIESSVFQQDTSAAFNTGTHHVINFTNKTVLKGTVQDAEGLQRVFSQLNQGQLKPFSIQLPQDVDEPINPDDKIDFHNIARALNHVQQHSKRPFVYLPEIGNSFFISFGLKTRGSSLGRSWLTNPWYAAMGTSLPYARAVCKNIQSRQLQVKPIVITGDGGFNFQHNELVHFLREDLHLVILYLRNNIFHLGKSSDADIYQCSTADLNLEYLIRGYGGVHHPINTVADLESILLKLNDESSGIHLLEINCDSQPENLCRELQMLNLYIRSQNGDKDAQNQWKRICNG